MAEDPVGSLRDAVAPDAAADTLGLPPAAAGVDGGDETPPDVHAARPSTTANAAVAAKADLAREIGMGSILPHPRGYEGRLRETRPSLNVSGQEPGSDRIPHRRDLAADRER